MAQGHIRQLSGRFNPQPVVATYLWHLMSPSKLQTFLDGGLWMARIDRFGDPSEGALPVPNLGLLNKLPCQQRPEVVKEYELGVKRAYASCWHMSDGDPSDYAWQHFGPIGLRTTPQLVSDALQNISGPDGPAYFGQIRYIDHWQDTIPEGNVIEASFVIQCKFRSENEARVLVYAQGAAASKHLFGKKGPCGHLVQAQPPSESDSGKLEFVGGYDGGKAIVIGIDPKRFIEEIVVHPSTPDSCRQEIFSHVAAAGLRPKLRM